MSRLVRRLLGDRAGAAVIEMALVLPVLVLFILGFLDFGYWIYVRSTSIGALESAARGAGVGGAAVDAAALQTGVENQVKRIAPLASFAWSVRNYYEFAGIGKPEKLITDVNGNGKYDPGDCWEDLIPNGAYDTTPGRAGVGGADDIIYYQLTVSFPPFADIGGFLTNLAGNHSTTVTTIVKRQPYAAQATPAIRC
ncbi:pilus assembly protein [Sphingomonas ginkgonis]|uniref:Pilus assembly protein n=1 Tax=Sphingomonas ginkgonis TaxID=2315330 RepID=A0A429VD09_9SPHN|nr:TadE family protein [Sphingomonas ginkgonis]RST31824.1 pilus assembly protein [Sphingomonas ginkgonis]